MKIDFGTISVWLAALAPLFALVLAVAVDRRRRKQTETPPQDEKLLRPAGHSLAIRLDDTIEKILSDILVASALSAFAGASAYSGITFLSLHAPVWLIVISFSLLAVFASTGILIALRAYKRIQESQNIRLGLRGEQAVAEALHELGDAGFRAFHDFPGGDDWNIDHITVGRRGVFLIETKARRRRGGNDGQQAHEVIYDGQFLRFPNWKESAPIEQAKNGAKWLSNFLEKKTGEPVRVEPLLVLPGWYVEYSEKRNFPVKAMNACYLVKFLRGQSECIADAQVRRIVAALDEKCRDVEF